MGTYNVSAEFEEKINDSISTPNCFRRKRRRRVVMLMAKPGTSFFLKGNCNESLGRANKKGYIRVNMPKGSFQRVTAAFPGGGKSQKVIDVGSGSTALRVNVRSGGKKCNLTRIRKKIYNKIFLEPEEVKCLRDVKPKNSAYFASQLALARFYCQKKAYSNGSRSIDSLSRNARNRFNPYRALQMGMEYGRCKKFRKALSLLKQAERMRNRFRPADKYRNSKALYFAMADFYERKYYSTKSVVDIRQALKSWQRYGEIARDGSSRAKAQKEAARLKGKLGGLGGGLDD